MSLGEPLATSTPAGIKILLTILYEVGINSVL